MEIKNFKAFHVYVNRAPKRVTLNHLRKSLCERPTIDPTGTQWHNGGFWPITEGEDAEFAIDVQGSALLSALQINERILPASVQKEAMAKRIREIEEREDRPATKQEYAQVRDDVVGTLLPRAFIRRTLVPIMFVTCDVGQVILVFTGSAKKADDTILALISTILDERIFIPALLSNIVTKTPSAVLTAAAKGDAIGDEDLRYMLEFATSAVLKGAGKQSIRIQHKDIGSPDVQNLLKQEYTVAKLGVQLIDSSDTGEDPTCSATISDKLVVTGLKIDKVKPAEKGAEAGDIADTFFNNLWLTAKEAVTFVNVLIDGMGGLIPQEEKTAVGSQDAPAKIGSGNGDAARESIINDPMQQTDLASTFGGRRPDDDGNFDDLDDL